MSPGVSSASELSAIARTCSGCSASGATTDEITRDGSLLLAGALLLRARVDGSPVGWGMLAAGAGVDAADREGDVLAVTLAGAEALSVATVDGAAAEDEEAENAEEAAAFAALAAGDGTRKTVCMTTAGAATASAGYKRGAAPGADAVRDTDGPDAATGLDAGPAAEVGTGGRSATAAGLADEGVATTAGLPDGGTADAATRAGCTAADGTGKGPALGAGLMAAAAAGADAGLAATLEAAADAAGPEAPAALATAKRRYTTFLAPPSQLPTTFAPAGTGAPDGRISRL